MSTEEDQARLIAERVARRMAGAQSPAEAAVHEQNGVARDELSAIRAGLHDLENKLERIESKLGQEGTQASERPRARVINFVSASPPIATAPPLKASAPDPSPAELVPPTRSPWIREFPVDHPSQERFGVEEATVSELVEFFENEKKCSVEPGGKPCDHCAMCSSRGF
jgi:hypothetical protein